MTELFRQITWDEALEQRCREIVRQAVREDLDRGYDWTTTALVPVGAQGRAAVVAHHAGIVAGLRAAAVAIDEMECQLQWTAQVDDGVSVQAHARLAEISGSARDLLTAERLLLNLIGHLSGIATLTHRFVQAVSHTRARIFDTRKTTPGWRELEKYAVGCGGGTNHRRGLYDAVLIKDNHLAFYAGQSRGEAPAAQAVQQARRFIQQNFPTDQAAPMTIEVEVDTLQQLDQVLAARPDIVLLDNMSPDELRQAVALRDQRGVPVALEASGGVDLETVAAIAETGVDAISIGGLTHSAPRLDVGLDWIE